MARASAHLLSACGFLTRRVWDVLRDKTGGTAIMIAFATLPLLAAGGLAIDISLAYMLKNQMSKALDTAGLAAGRVAFESFAADDAERFFNANFDPGQRSKRSMRPTPSQKFFQNACSEAMNRTWPSEDSYIW